MSHTWAVLPVQDAIAHTADEDCICGPELLPLPTADGQIWWAILHHGLTVGEVSTEYRTYLTDWAAEQTS